VKSPNVNGSGFLPVVSVEQGDWARAVDTAI
jgi:hypothetical protein